jgi:hypothetical protein
MSSLLAGYPVATRLMENGDLVPDRIVADALLKSLLPQATEANPSLNAPSRQHSPGGHASHPSFHSQSFSRFPAPRQQPSGLVVDGFPRSAAQVRLIKDLQECFSDLAAAASGTRCQYHMPRFQVVVLDVDEETSVQRQLGRVAEIARHNAAVTATGAGSTKCVSPTRSLNASAWPCLSSGMPVVNHGWLLEATLRLSTLDRRE